MSKFRRPTWELSDAWGVHVECLGTTGKSGFGNLVSQVNQPKRMQEGFTPSSDLYSPPSLLRLESQGPQEAICIPLVLQGRWVK